MVTRFAIPLAEGEQPYGFPFRSVAISPDGSKIVYAVGRRLMRRSMTDAAAHVIQGTDTGGTIGTPVFSPDGRSVVYASLGGDLFPGLTLKTIQSDGGVPATIAQIRATTVF